MGRINQPERRIVNIFQTMVGGFVAQDALSFSQFSVLNPDFKDWVLRRIKVTPPYVNRLGGTDIVLIDTVTLLVNAVNKIGLDISVVAGVSSLPTEYRIGFAQGYLAADDLNFEFNQVSNSFQFFATLQAGFLATDLNANINANFEYEKKGTFEY